MSVRRKTSLDRLMHMPLSPCRVRNLRTISIFVIISCLVVVPVSFIHVSPDTLSVSPGDTVRLDCVASGYPIPTVTWSARTVERTDRGKGGLAASPIRLRPSWAVAISV